MGHRPVARDAQHRLISRHPAIRGKREGFQQRALGDAREQMGDHLPIQRPALRTQVMQPRTLAQIDLCHDVRPRAGRAGFQHRQFRARLKADDVMQDHIRGLRALAVGDMERFQRLAGDVQQHAIGGGGGVQRREGAFDGRVALPLKHTVKRLGPVDVGAVGLGQTRDLNPRQRRIVRGFGIEDAIDENQTHLVTALEDRRVDAEGRATLRFGRVEARRIGPAPVFVAPRRQAHFSQPRQRRRPGGRGEPALRRVKRRDPRFGRLDPRGHVPFRCRHQAVSPRISE